MTTTLSIKKSWVNKNFVFWIFDLNQEHPNLCGGFIMSEKLFPLHIA